MFLLLTHTQGHQIRINVEHISCYNPNVDGGTNITINAATFIVTEKVEEVDRMLTELYVTVKK